MDHVQAKELSQRMVKDLEKKAPSGFGRDSYILGGLQVRLETVLTFSNLKFSDFNKEGNYDLSAVFKRKIK